jgi:hypothetical protein
MKTRQIFLANIKIGKNEIIQIFDFRVNAKSGRMRKVEFIAIRQCVKESLNTERFNRRVVKQNMRLSSFA